MATRLARCLAGDLSSAQSMINTCVILDYSLLAPGEAQKVKPVK